MESVKLMRDMMIPFHYHKFGEKSWGFEYWFENNKQYCGKIIQVRKDEWSSYGAFHYHKIKDETFLVISGTLLLDVLDLSNVSRAMIGLENGLKLKEENIEAEVNRYYLKPFNYMRLRPGTLHRFSSLEREAIFTETSTTHMEEDSYRIKFPDPDEQLQFPINHEHDHSKFAIGDRFSYKLREKEEIII